MAEVGGERSADACRAGKGEVIYTSYLNVVKHGRSGILPGTNFPAYTHEVGLQIIFFSLLIVRQSLFKDWTNSLKADHVSRLCNTHMVSLKEAT